MVWSNGDRRRRAVGFLARQPNLAYARISLWLAGSSDLLLPLLRLQVLEDRLYVFYAMFPAIAPHLILMLLRPDIRAADHKLKYPIGGH